MIGYHIILGICAWYGTCILTGTFGPQQWVSRETQFDKIVWLKRTEEENCQAALVGLASAGLIYDM
jgi:hypothetical protein